MKNSKINIRQVIFFTILLCTFFSACNDDYLEEVPKGFLSPENTFVNKEGFESAISDLYRVSRSIISQDKLPGMLSSETDKTMEALYFDGTDFGWFNDKILFMADYSTLNSDNAMAQNFWITFYTMIKGANIILERSNSDSLNWKEGEKEEIQAKAKFFRAWAYRYLVYLYGGVPLIDEEISGPKLDFVRSPKEEVLQFIVDDLEFATQFLPVTNNRDGRLSKAAADQLLAEIYISQGKYDQSIAAASRIIGDGQYHLMTERFGNYSQEPGDVFWDLFRLGNQNNPANKEVILAWQFEYNVPGGDAELRLQRIWGPFLERLKDPDGNLAILKDKYLGRPVGFSRISNYLEYNIWRSDWDNDIRNSEYNIQRKFYINNPDSPFFGQQIMPTPTDTVRNIYAYITKITHVHGAPQGYDTSGNIFKDIYAMRFAETYLLRAEAYLDKGDKVSAANDLNVIRNRANATPVNPEDVDIDYILDERARELVTEEPRRLTLSRLGLLAERVKKYNPVSGPTIQEFNNLLPIPQTEIDANVEAELTQNPGY
jgi:hypothetical protein